MRRPAALWQRPGPLNLKTAVEAESGGIESGNEGLTVKALRAKQDVKEADRVVAQARDMKRRRAEKSTARMALFSTLRTGEAADADPARS